MNQNPTIYDEADDGDDRLPSYRGGPVRTRLPAGLTEEELFLGYARIAPAEVVALGAVIAGSLAAVFGVWPWGGAL